MSKPLLTIGMPVYNGEDYIQEALDSLLGQTFDDFTLLISDNGSTDGTRKICEAYCSKDARIQYFRNEVNRGAAYNFNRVFALSESKYFKWAAHDDLCGPSFLTTCIQVLEHRPDVVVAYCRTAVMNADGMVVGEYPDNSNFQDNSPVARFRSYLSVYRYPRQCHPVFGVIRSRILKETSRIKSYVGSDRILLGELVLRGKFYEVPEVLFFSRFHPRSSVRKYPSYRDRVAWFDPSKRGTLQPVRWIQMREYLAAIHRSPLSPREKTTCRLMLGKWMLWNCRGLLKDALKCVAWPFIRPVIFRDNQIEEVVR